MKPSAIVGAFVCFALAASAPAASQSPTLLTVVRGEDSGLTATLVSNGTLTFGYQPRCPNWNNAPCFAFQAASAGTSNAVSAPECQVFQSPNVASGSATCAAAGVTSVTLVVKAQGSVNTIGADPSGNNACSSVPLNVRLNSAFTSAQLADGCAKRVSCADGFAPTSVVISVDASVSVDASCTRYVIQKSPASQ